MSLEQLNENLKAKLAGLDQHMINDLKTKRGFEPALCKPLFATAVILGFKPNENDVRAMLKKEDFLETLQNFDVNSLSADTHKMIDKYVHHKEFTAQFISRFNVACCYLCEWVLELHHSHSQQLAVKAVDQHEGPEHSDALYKRFKGCHDFSSQFPKFMTQKKTHSRGKSVGANLNIMIGSLDDKFKTQPFSP